MSLSSFFQKATSLIKNKFLFSCIITFFTLGIIATLAETYPFSEIFSRSNLGIRNMLFTIDVPGREQKISPNLVFVAIDDATLSDKEQWWLGRWQEFRREYYARVIDVLKKHWALAIGIDVLFSEKAEGDGILSESIKKAGNVVLGMSYRQEGEMNDILFPRPDIREKAAAICFFQQAELSMNLLVLQHFGQLLILHREKKHFFVLLRWRNTNSLNSIMGTISSFLFQVHPVMRFLSIIFRDEQNFQHFRSRMSMLMGSSQKKFGIKLFLSDRMLLPFTMTIIRPLVSFPGFLFISILQTRFSRIISSRIFPQKPK